MRWTESGLELLDQTRLPREEVWVLCRTAEEVAKAIESMKVRGAPAIGAAAAYAVALEAERSRNLAKPDFLGRMELTLTRLARTRPTAVNLFWAIQRMRDAMLAADDSVSQMADRILREAERIARQDIDTNRAIGRYGASLFDRPVQILTHCNTGSLATVEYGTALGVIRALHEAGHLRRVWVDETRPFLQGARLTAFELSCDGIPHTLITDNMAAHFMQRGEVDAVIVGADRIAANGDTANKIGTYGLAVLCRFHQIPFYVAAPAATFDLTIATGAEIPIEERSPLEVTHVAGQQIAPDDTPAAHPAFDVTPHSLITAIVTEHGVIHHPSTDTVRAVLRGA